MLPEWSLNETPLVFIILWYGLLNVFLPKPDVCSQGSDISLKTIYESCQRYPWLTGRWDREIVRHHLRLLASPLTARPPYPCSWTFQMRHLPL